MKPSKPNTTSQDDPKKPDLNKRIQELEDKLEMSLMVSEALWEIIKKSHNLDESHLTALIHDIDLKDGRLDGKVAKTTPDNCVSCGEILARGKSQCMYCGQLHQVQPFKR